MIRTFMPGASDVTSAWFTAARTRMVVGSTTSRIGMPVRTSSPSCISAIVPPLKTERRTTRPSSRRDDAHACGVRGGVVPRVLGAFAPNLEYPQICRGSAFVQFVGLAQLCQLRAGLLQDLLVLLGRDLGKHFDAHQVQLGATDGVFSDLQPRLPGGPSRDVLCVLLVDLREEIPILRLTIPGVLQLRGAVELHQQFPAAPVSRPWRGGR